MKGIFLSRVHTALPAKGGAYECGRDQPECALSHPSVTAADIIAANNMGQ